MNSLGYDSYLIKEIKKQKAKRKNKNVYLVDELSILEKYLASKHKADFRLAHLLICKELYGQYKNCPSFAELCICAENIYEVSQKTYLSIIKKSYSEGLYAVFYGRDKCAPWPDTENMKKIVVLDGLEYPGNIGTILRTADAAQIDGVIVTNCKTNMNNDKIIAGSRGMVFKVPFYTMDADRAADFLASRGYNILLCEPEGGIPYTSADYSGKTAMVFGSEGRGICKAWFDVPHTKVYIPMSGDMHSLNVGVAASIIMYESYVKGR